MVQASAPPFNRVALPPEGASVAVARRFVRRAIASWGLGGLIDTAVLLTSEIVTNAIVHAGTEVDVSCRLVDDALEVAVTDRYPTRQMPLQPTLAPPEAEGGRGLGLAAALASAWGVEYSGTRKRVWVRITDEAAAAHAQRDDKRAESAEPTESAGLPAPRDDTPLATPSADSDATVALVRTDDEGWVSYWSSEATTLFGWASAQVIGRPLAELLSWAGPGPAEATLAMPRWQGTYAVLCADGTTRPVFADHVRAGHGRGGRAVVCLLVMEEHRRLLETPLVRSPGAAGTRTGPIPATSGRTGLEPLLRHVTETARDLLDSDAAFVLLASDDERVFVLRASTGLARAEEPRLVVVDEHEAPESAWQLPRVIDALEETELAELAHSGLASAVTVPVNVGDRVVGVLACLARTPARFTRDDAVRLAMLAADVALDVGGARLIELERSRRGLLSFLADASELLASTLDPAQTTALVTQLVVPRLARWCAVHSTDETGALRLDQVWHVDENRLDKLRAELDETIDAVDAPQGPADDVTLGLPLVARGRRIGALTLGREPGSRFGDEEMAACEDLARRAALALDNARLYADRARESQALQRSLLPRRLPEIPRCELGVAYAAAGEGNEVGGDFYDVFEITGSRWGFAVGDVCGKGPEAAAITGLARHSLRVHARRGDSVPSVLTHLNEAVLEETDRDRFITLLYGELWPQSDGTLRVVLACAGHPPPVRISPTGEIRPVGTPQPLLGVLDDPAFTVDTLDLRAGESLVAFTDGVTERRSEGQMFGDSGLARTLAEDPSLPADVVAERIEQAVVGFARTPPRDDMAVLVVRAT